METQKDLSIKGQWLGRPSKPFLEVICSTPTKDKDSLYLPFQQKEEIKWKGRYHQLYHPNSYGLIVKDVSRFAYFKANYALFNNPCVTWKEPEKVPFVTAECTGEITSKQYDMELFKRWLEDVWYHPVTQARKMGKTFITAGVAEMAMFDQLIQQEYGKKTSI